MGLSVDMQNAGILRAALMHLLLTTAILAAPQAASIQSTSVSIAQPSIAGSATMPGVSPATDSPDDLADFGDTVQVLGAMERTDQDFKDGFALDLFSPKNRTIQVTQNKSPLNGSFVKGTTGEPFAALANYSYILKMNESANDLVAKVELPYDPEMLEDMGVDAANLYVGTLSSDKKSWIISEEQRNVHVSENKTRIIKMTSLDGEYILLGRKTEDTSNIFVQYGQGDTRTVNITGGPGIQEAEFVDGLRFTMESKAPLKFNADFKEGIAAASLPPGFRALNTYSWSINTTQQAQGSYSTTIRFPVNKDILQKMVPRASSVDMVSVARKDSKASSSTYTVLNDLRRDQDSIVADGISRLDGNYALLVSIKQNGTALQAAKAATGGASKVSPLLSTVIGIVIVSVIAV